MTMITMAEIGPGKLSIKDMRGNDLRVGRTQLAFEYGMGLAKPGDRREHAPRDSRT